jgi:hypothetical protein
MRRRSTAVNSKKVNSVQSEVSAAKSERTRHVRCSKRTKDFNSQPLQTPTVYWRDRHRTVNSALSGVPSTTTTRRVVGDINSPQPPPFNSSKFSELNIQYKSKKLHSKTQSIDQILSKPSNQLNCLVTWERVFCVLLLLLLLGLLSPSHSYSSKYFVKLARDT